MPRCATLKVVVELTRACGLVQAPSLGNHWLRFDLRGTDIVTEQQEDPLWCALAQRAGRLAVRSQPVGFEMAVRVP